MTSTSAIASDYLFDSGSSSSPPNYNDAIKMTNLPSEPLLERGTIFGDATSVHFEWNSSDIYGMSFLIRDTNGSLQAKGDAGKQNTRVRSINGMDLLNITAQDIEVINQKIVRTFGVYHKNAFIGTVKTEEKSHPNSSLHISCRNPNRPKIVVNSLKIGDYAIFRQNMMSSPLCHLQMPNVEIYNKNEFDVKIIFYPQTGITEEEQLLCTAAAIAFKLTMKQMLKTKAEEGACLGYFGGIACLGFFILLLIGFYFILEKWGCEHKKAQGYAAYKYRDC
ncbi:hypothetical protein Bhyg_01407 [Pseudolycoriella hygida]|uniref:Uncharacterized protein n=1 Tax=Pseudolycoriella hygida TaxID=35572 RepID=A0A9Q0N9B1_9DIPT|nr:hypothetical protein Bhyg_01407 [Pseudolycoriella hygida]